MNLRVRFAPPADVAFDARLVVQVDDDVLYDGSFLAGCDATREVPEGPHVLSAKVHTSVVRRGRKYRFDVRAEGYRDAPTAVTVRLEYNRRWGNFTRKLVVEEGALDTGAERE